MKKIIIILAILIYSTANADNRYVPTQYSTIQAALDAAIDYDTIFVDPGTYNENIRFYGKRVFLFSVWGPDSTVINGILTHTPTVSMIDGEPKGTKIGGFTITGGDRSGILVDGGSPTITYNVIRDNANNYNYSGGGIYLTNTTGVVIFENKIFNNSVNNYGGGIYLRSGCESDTIYYNLVYNNSGGGQIASSGSDNTLIQNNTISGDDSYGLRVNSYSSDIYVFNNIFVGNSGGAIRAWDGNVIAQYNCFHDNGWETNSYYSDIPVEFDETNIFADPQVVDYFNADFRLTAHSPCIDGGNPNLNYYWYLRKHDDIGALDYEEIAPIAVDLNFGDEFQYNILNQTPTFYWSFYDPSNSVQGFNVEVDTNYDWSDAVYWQSGQQYLADTSVLYAGLSLEDSVTYYYRVQVYNGTDWSEWVASNFRMNSPPTVPVLNEPIGDSVISVSSVNLVITNSTDAQFDSVTYDFELYSDPGLTTLVYSDYNVLQTDEITTSGFINGLNSNTTYYWRSRSFDGFEYSDWTVTESFITRTPVVYNVPLDFSTIQAAVDAASSHDTVLVAPGTYTGDGNRDITFNGKNIILVSTDGPDVTIIDCQGTDGDNHSGFSITGGEDSTAVIDGFTITGAYQDYYQGAVIIDWNSAVTLSNCFITGNTSNGISGFGGGVIENCQITHNSKNGLIGGYLTVRNNLIAYNDLSGVHSEWGELQFYNNTVVYNGMHGLFLEGTPPLKEINSTEDTDDNNGADFNYNIVGYNGYYGIYQIFLFIDSIYCNTVFGNDSGFSHYPYYFDDNDTLPPLFCDASNSDFTLSSSSPCLPQNSSCGELIGAFGQGSCTGCCLGAIRGNVDYDIEDIISISDLIHLVDYMFLMPPEAPDIVCDEEADIDGSGEIDISDLLYLVDYMFLPLGEPPPPHDCP